MERQTLHKRVWTVDFLNARLPGGSYCMQGMRYAFADIVRAYHKITLLR